MIATIVTLIGNAVTDVRVTTTNGGVTVGHFRMAATPRRYDAVHERWIDGETTFITVNCWRALAENAAASVHKGDPVLVTGRLRTHAWERDGTRHEELEVEATSVGHDLTRGRTTFDRSRRGPQLTSSEEQRETLGRLVAAASDPEPGREVA